MAPGAHRLSRPADDRSEPTTRRSVDIVLGTLGQAVRDAGGLTAAIGNSDSATPTSDAILQRPAAIAAMDASGLVPYGDVSVDLLEPSASAPYGRSTDLAFEAAFDRVTRSLRAHKGPVVHRAWTPATSHARRDFSAQAADDVVAAAAVRRFATLDNVVAMADADAEDRRRRHRRLAGALRGRATGHRRASVRS